ncbi:probable G-protein coupled receptor 139 [Callorhinchus milii]|uniref:probable G-protein coupled receptor 139 n=1 Tax=Callorhinchus milii TaxID=7868 RepID=UPI001C3FCC1B|nr:probable G-protein coupled receptor 139 [Callorhinchus milii]
MGQPVILVVKDIFYPVLAAFVVPANLLTIVVLWRGAHGLSRGITRYMLAMAMAGLLVLLFNVILHHILMDHFPFTFLARTSFCRVHTFLKSLGLDISVWFTVSLTFDRFIAICHQKARLVYCTEQTAIAVILIVSAIFILKNVPFLLLFEPRFTIGSVSWGCSAKAAFFTLPFWEALTWLCSLSTPLMPFVLIIFFNALTARFILAASRRRRMLRRGDTTGLGNEDPEIRSRQRSIVLLFTISGSFVLLWTTVTVSFLSTRVVVTHFSQISHTDPGYIATECGRLLMLLYSSANTCIYAVIQNKFRFRQQMATYRSKVKATVIQTD